MDQASFSAWALPPGAARPIRTLELPPDAGYPGTPPLCFPVLEAAEMAALCEGLLAARERISRRRAREIARALGAVGARFLDPGDPLRAEALARLPASAGLSEAMAREVLDGMAEGWLPDRLEALLDAEFLDPAVLDGFASADTGSGGDGRRLRALGHGLTLHVGAGNVPGVSVTSLIRALLVKSAVLLKPGRSDLVLPLLYARALAQHDSELARAAAVVYWPGGAGGEGEEEAFRAADLVVAYGGEDALRSVRDRLPLTTRFLPYHHRVSFGVLAREAGDEGRAPEVARAAARATALFDRRGCVSPHLFYVEEGGKVAAREWAALIADGLRELEVELPSGPVSAGEASEVQQLRGAVEMAAAAGRGHELHRDDGVGWTVIYDPDPTFETSCPGRSVRIKPVQDLTEIAVRVEPYGRYLQTVGFAGGVGSEVGAGAGGGERYRAFAEALAQVGATRFTSFQKLPWPPPWWHHDGAGPLAALVRWVEVEGEP